MLVHVMLYTCVITHTLSRIHQEPIVVVISFFCEHFNLFDQGGLFLLKL
jgi:hypothetical protein